MSELAGMQGGRLPLQILSFHENLNVWVTHLPMRVTILGLKITDLR